MIKSVILRIISYLPLQSRNSTSQIEAGNPGEGSISQKLSLWSGLVLMLYVVLHYINHSLGNISLGAMEIMLSWQIWIWQSFPGSILLYGALLTHVCLVIWKFSRRNSLRLPLWEWTQIILGLLIPYFLLTHVIAMRSPVRDLGISIDYAIAFGMIWPGAALSQNILLLVTWTHGCLGLHFWLRLNSWYKNYFGWIFSIAILLPALALTGWINAARFNLAKLQVLKSESPDEAAGYFDTIRYIAGETIPKIVAGNNFILGLGAALLAAGVVYQLTQRFGKRVQIDYGNGKIITSVPGSTILEISRQAGIPHMSVCGGRARCSTCRTLIIEGSDNLMPKTEAEIKLLKRLNAADSIRLGCQAKVKGNITVRPLVQPQGGDVATITNDPLGWGVEKQIAILFLDIRGFSKISEKSLPYDVVFILNSFFGEVSAAVENNSGYIDKFMGDGMMALFGLAGSDTQASRSAIQAAIDCEKAARNVSKILTQHLAEPIKIGIGIHVGDAVIGRIGKIGDQSSPSRLTAIGDSVNISARLEQATKEFTTPLVISVKTANLAGLEDINTLGIETQITVRNISKPVDILAVGDLQLLDDALKGSNITKH